MNSHLNKQLFMKLGLVLLSTSIFACSKGGNDAKAGGSSVQTQTTMAANQAGPNLYYHPVYHAGDANDSSLQTLVDDKGNVLVHLTAEQSAACNKNGSCSFIMGDGTMKHLGVKARIDGIMRFYERQTAKCPYGVGSYGICVDPFFSIAADSSSFKEGDVLFISKLKDMQLPTGETHDGYVIVRDDRRGGLHSLVFFTGFYSHTDARNTFAQKGLGVSTNVLEFERVTDQSIIDAVHAKRGYPNLSQDTYDRGMKEINGYLQMQ